VVRARSVSYWCMALHNLTLRYILYQFQSYAKEVADISLLKAETSFGVIRSFSKSVTVAAETSVEIFPFFTMPFFEVQGEEARKISGAEVVLFAPLVKTSDKLRWEDYSVAKQSWLQEGLTYRGLPNVDPGPIAEEIYAYEVDKHKTHKAGEIHVDGYFLPVWQMAGAPVNASIINLDLLTRSSFEHAMVDVIEQREGTLSYVSDFNYLTENSVEGDNGFHIQSYVLEPVFESFDSDATVVGFIVAVLPWNTYFENVIPEGTKGVNIVIDDQCGDVFTYEINGANSTFLGSGDLHETAYDSNVYSIDFATFARYEGSPHPSVNGSSYNDYFKGTNDGHCKYVFNIYPSAKLEAQYTSNKHIIYAAAVVGIFATIALLLVIYDRTVIRSQQALLDGANRIIGSLFPEAVQKQLMEQATHDGKRSGARTIKGYLGDEEHNKGMLGSTFTTKPIAELFPAATIMFADISGFTAWSSTREPTQVFTLLETIYHAFDEIAKQRRVFKVETVGDCYVAVAGLPDRRRDHAVVMGRFAHSCISKFSSLVKQMESTLGPDTSELGLRVGLHSGPVTAGVLRGEKARFQLFGDSMNTTARIETGGQKNKIHISEATAALVRTAGKGHWLRERPDKIVAKGKGELTTFWLVPKAGTNSSGQSSCSYSSAPSSEGDPAEPGDAVNRMENAAGKAGAVEVERKQRLIKWNTEMLSKIVKTIVAHRIDSGIQPDDSNKIVDLERGACGPGTRVSSTVVDEVVEVVHLPKFDASAQHKEPTDPDTIELPEAAVSQLEDYVQAVAAMYPNNPFHNFEHASHVAMSVQKLLSRIVAPEVDSIAQSSVAAMSLHDHTYGITSDPLLHFAVVLSALIHDVDHPGVPNSTLVQEKTSLAAVYKNKSVAEQNSVDLAWSLLMDDTFVDLRQVLYTTEADFKRIRQLIVNSVMATDIMDKELGAFRKARWERAFSEGPIDGSCNEGDDYAVHRKATIVLEHLIQASDVAHTMQHWHVYIKWNERLFDELYKAFLDGRADTDPSINWYKGEMGFFDFYIIPLTKKLESCGVFGVSSAEYLDYAQHNRREWEMKGQEAVAGYLEKYSVF